MPRSRDELVPIFNFGCRLWMRGFMASDHGVWNVGSRVNVSVCEFGPIWWCEFGPIRGGRIWCEMGPIYTLISWPIFGLPISRFVWGPPKRSPRMRQNSPPRAPKMTPKNTPFFPIFPQFSPKNRGLWQPYLGFLINFPIKRHEFVLNGGPIRDSWYFPHDFPHFH
jgi:hypothetical protein